MSQRDPAEAEPGPAGSFVRRVAGTAHYDGVVPDATEPAVIAAPRFLAEKSAEPRRRPVERHQIVEERRAGIP